MEVREGEVGGFSYPHRHRFQLAASWSLCVKPGLEEGGRDFGFFKGGRSRDPNTHTQRVG